MSLLEVKNLRTYFHTRNGVVKAVDGINFCINKGEVLGIVGESGSGKSVTNYSLLDLLPRPPGRIESGEALFEGKDLFKLTPEQIRQIRGQNIAMIFQDPMICLNPYMTIGDQLTEAILVHKKMKMHQAKERVINMLNEVGIHDAQERLNSYPHHFSGGMRQRVMIAMALIAEPQILIADEPTTALDVTVEAQILDLLQREQQERHMAIIYVTHNLGVIARLAHRINVMYAGRIVETGTADQIFYKPSHPYTRALLASIPAVHQRGEKLYTIPGLPPDVSKPMMGCSFTPRCQFAQERCGHEEQTLREIGPAHRAACYQVQEGDVLV